MIKKIFIIFFIAVAFFYASEEVYWKFLLEKQKMYIKRNTALMKYDVEKDYEDLIDSGLKIKPKNLIFRYEKMRICLIRKEYKSALDTLIPIQNEWEAKQFICAIYDYLNYPEHKVQSCYNDVVNLLYKKKNMYSNDAYINDAYIMALFFANEISCTEAHEKLLDHSIKEILVKNCDRKKLATNLINGLSGR